MENPHGSIFILFFQHPPEVAPHGNVTHPTLLLPVTPVTVEFIP